MSPRSPFGRGARSRPGARSAGRRRLRSSRGVGVRDDHRRGHRRPTLAPRMAFPAVLTAVTAPMVLVAPPPAAVRPVAADPATPVDAVAAWAEKPGTRPASVWRRVCRARARARWQALRCVASQEWVEVVAGEETFRGDEAAFRRLAFTTARRRGLDDRRRWWQRSVVLRPPGAYELERSIVDEPPGLGITSPVPNSHANTPPPVRTAPASRRSRRRRRRARQGAVISATASEGRSRAHRTGGGGSGTPTPPARGARFRPSPARRRPPAGTRAPSSPPPPAAGRATPASTVAGPPATEAARRPDPATAIPAAARATDPAPDGSTVAGGGRLRAESAEPPPVLRM